MPLHLLVIEGNVRAARENYRAAFGKTASESYAAVLGEIAPDAMVDICCPADGDASLPDAAGLEAYDGVAITGSALNLYNGGSEVLRQIDLARAVFASHAPFFGSCWGLQVASAAAGGEVIRNPKGREIGFARNIFPTEAGRAHTLLRGRGGAYDAPCSHLDIVARSPRRENSRAECDVGGAGRGNCLERRNFLGRAVPPGIFAARNRRHSRRAARDCWCASGSSPTRRPRAPMSRICARSTPIPGGAKSPGGWGSATTCWSRRGEGPN